MVPCAAPRLGRPRGNASRRLNADPKAHAPSDLILLAGATSGRWLGYVQTLTGKSAWA
jgi:hypothetical protein